MINICLSFVKVYKDEGPVRDLGKIIMNYLTGNFIFDMAATLPGLITNQSNPNWYLIKLIRLKDLSMNVKHLTDLCHTLLMFFGIRKTIVEKSTRFIEQLIYVVIAIFFLASIWVLLGRNPTA